MSGENRYGAHQVSGTAPYPPHPHSTIVHHPSLSEPSPAPGITIYGYREEHSEHFGTAPVNGEMMAGVVGGHPGAHPGQGQYAYHDMDPSQRPPSQVGQPQWHAPYYGNHMQMPGPEGDPSMRQMMPEATPVSPHHATGQWERARSSFSRPPSQDSNTFSHHQNMAPSPQGQKYGQQQFTRPMEPNAAPSPPTQYPNSPRTPLPNQMGPPTPGLPPHGSQSYRPPHGARTSLSITANPNADGIEGRPFVEPPHPSPLRSPMDVPRYVNGNQNPFITQGQSLQQSAYTHHRTGSLGDGRPDLRRHHSSDARIYGGDDHDVKRESGSRVHSVSMSPSSHRMSYGDGQDSPSGQSANIGNGETVKKKGSPVFRDPLTGIDYYENEPVPPTVQIPEGWQRGNGKQTMNILLPLEKDGIQVNPEWGLTAGGKARQRLPSACINCRQKKIKCVENDNDDTICQHCSKMRIPCSRLQKYASAWLKDVEDTADPGRDEEKKKRSRTSISKSNSEGERSSSIGSTANHSGIPNGHSSKKRKSSMEPSSQESKKANRTATSRGASLSREHVDTVRANQYMSGQSPGPHSAPLHMGSDGRPPPFPTIENGMVPSNAYEDPEESRQRHIIELRRNNFGPPTGYPDASPQSYPPSSPSVSVASGSGVIVPYHPPPPSAPSIHSYQSKSDSKGSGSHHERSSTPQTMGVTSPSAPAPMYRMLEPNSMSSHLPPPDLLDVLVKAYFTHFYSQTYAFLHKPSFIRTLNQQPPILLFSICAVAARFTKECTSQAAEVWADCTRQLIMQNYDTYTLEVVQSMVHMGIHDFGTNNGHKAWIFAGMAVRMGSAMNMNLEKHKKDMSTINKEVTRRTYWSYYLMDRFNSYGVARPYLIQDHDCHIQLPCNQPSFEKGEDVKTEHLLGPNPQHPDAGTTYMGAFAFLVRITCIWSNILREIHFLTLKQKDDNTSKHFDDFVSQLEKWRTGLPEGLAYSNDNLAGQIKVGTTGAFVMMHVMWHMAMAYVHRYIRTGGAKVDLTNEGDKNLIVESIRRAFIHGDAILQIMYHVRRRRDSMPAGEEPIVVNAPFLGQAIFDACYITVTRALEVRNEPGGARDQKIRVNTGLAWLRELKRYWKPLGGMYKRIKKICNQLDTHSHPPSSFMPPQAPTPESSTNSGERDSYMQNTPWMPAGTLEFDHEPDGSFGGADLGNGLLLDPNDAISFGGQFPDFLSMPVPQRFFNLAFGQNSISSLASYAVYENGFPDLYQIVTSSYADPTIPAGHPIDHHISPPIPQGSQMSFNNGPTDIDEDASDDDDDDTQDPPGQTSTSGGGRDIHTTYFDPGAVHDGKLQDSASDTSGRSRRASEAGPTSKSGPTNRMDVLNLINTTGVEGRVAEALPQKYTTDKFTGAGGTIAPDGEERD